MTDLLFNTYALRDALDSQERTIAKEVDSLEENQILNSSPSDLCKYFVEKYTVETIAIDEERIQADYGDVQVDVNRRFDYIQRPGGGPTLVTGTRIVFYIPFQGDKDLLACRASTHSLSGVRAAVRKSELIFTYDRTAQDAANIQAEFQQDLKRLRQTLGWIKADVDKFNTTIEERANQFISSRREKLLHDRGIVKNLGYPLRRSDAPTTYVTSEVKRRIKPHLPPVSTEPYEPEPAVGLDDYEHVLSVISNMAQVMERSPGAFCGMSEEDLRQHFLVQLNGHYEGQATGETFNYTGKTDILIRVDGKNIFISECKFWTGPSSANNAIDQLLGYTSWRDTKTALLLLNRDRKMSTVLEKIPDVVKGHSSFKRELPYDSETGFRYILGNRDDPNREVMLTVLVFDVPA